MWLSILVLKEDSPLGPYYNKNFCPGVEVHVIFILAEYKTFYYHNMTVRAYKGHKTLPIPFEL